MKQLESYLVFGYKGRLVVAGTHSEMVGIDEQIRAKGVDHPFLADHIEVDYLQTPLVFDRNQLRDPSSDLVQELQPFYSSYGRYGDFGDVMLVTYYSESWILTAIGRKKFKTPGLAADILPIAIDQNGQQYFLGVIRGSDPGKGSIATVGGFIDIGDDCQLETAPECLRHEALEEIGLSMSFPTEFCREVYDSPFPNRTIAHVDLMGESVDSELTQLGFFYSPSTELREEFGTKRVHAAIAYILPINLKQNIDPQKLLKALKPEDKVENNKPYVWDMSLGTPNFGSPGHRHMYQRATEFSSLKI